jgi:plasmid stability protein
MAEGLGGLNQEIQMTRKTNPSDRGTKARAKANAEKEYLFDAKLFATLRIKAASRKERKAEATLRDILNGASCNAGQYPNGDPVLFETSIDGELDLLEVDGEYID